MVAEYGGSNSQCNSYNFATLYTVLVEEHFVLLRAWPPFPISNALIILSSFVSLQESRWLFYYNVITFLADLAGGPAAGGHWNRCFVHVVWKNLFFSPKQQLSENVLVFVFDEKWANAVLTSHRVVSNVHVKWYRNKCNILNYHKSVSYLTQRPFWSFKMILRIIFNVFSNNCQPIIYLLFVSMEKRPNNSGSVTKTIVICKLKVEMSRKIHALRLRVGTI